MDRCLWTPRGNWSGQVRAAKSQTLAMARRSAGSVLAYHSASSISRTSRNLRTGISLLEPEAAGDPLRVAPILGANGSFLHPVEHLGRHDRDRDPVEVDALGHEAGEVEQLAQTSEHVDVKGPRR